MAEAIDIEVRFDGMEDAIQALNELIRKLDSTVEKLGEAEQAGEGAGKGIDEAGERAKRSGGGFTNLAGNLASTSFAFNQVTQAVRAIGGAMKDAFDEVERVSGVFNRFNGDIREAAERTNGLFTRLDLMSQSARLAQAGLNLTATEMANLSVAAAETAAATGEDATQALRRLTDTLINAEEGGARRLGVSLQGISDVAERQQVILRELGNQYGDTESKVDSFGGLVSLSINRLGDFADAIIDSTSSVFDFGDSLDSTGENVNSFFDDLINETEDGTNAIDRFFAQAQGAAVEYGETVISFFRLVSATISGTQEEADAAFADLYRAGERGEQARDDALNRARGIDSSGTLNLPAIDVAGSTGRRRGGGGGGGRAREEEDILEIEERRRRVLEDQRATIAEIQEDLDRIAQAEADALRASEQALQSERERAKAASEVVAAKLAQQENDSALALASSLEQQLDEAIGSSGVQSRLEALGDLLDDVSRVSVEVKGVPEAVERVNQLAEKLREAQEEARNIQATNIAEGVNEGFETAFDLIENAIQKTREYRAEIEAEIELRKAQGASAAELEKLQKKLDKARAEGIKAALNEFLKKTAREEVIKGLSELAQGIGLSIANPPEAATHYASAAAHFVVAGLAGAGAAATAPSSTSAGGGGAGGPAATPEPFDNNPSQNDQPQTVVVNYNSLVSGAEVGLHADETRREYERRFNTQRG